MKKYFVEWLPTIDTIKVGDRVIHPSYNDGNPIKVTTDTEADVLSDGGQVTKLFLCSSEIYNNEPPEGTYIDSKVLGPGQIKATVVIGQISSNATWVKAGDQFDDNEVRLMKAIKVKYSTRAHGGEYNMILGSEDSYSKSDISRHFDFWFDDSSQFGITSAKCNGDVFIESIKIKGPCGHFH